MTTQPPQPNNPERVIPVLHPTVPMPRFSFFQVVKVKTTKEVAMIVGMWCVQTERQTYQWLYRLEGLTEHSTTWWQELQLRSFDRRRND